MFAGSVGDMTRIAMLVAAAASKSVRGRLYRSMFYRWRFSGRIADRLLLAPQDIRTSDPTIANEIYSGHFSLAGQTAVIEAGSPFTAQPPSSEWQRALLGFGWLRHLRATNTALARSQARGLVDDWIATQGNWSSCSFDPTITARRIMAWLCHSPLILDGADRAYYRRFMRSLNKQIRYLRHAAMLTPDGLPRLQAVIALNYAGLCIAGLSRLQRQAAQWLDDELVRQILPDGGHISRNPDVIVELLLDLLPLRQTFTAREIPPPSALLNAIDRMMPMIRFFRHGDGSFALFNGMGASPADAIATVLAYDDAFGKPIGNASHSGYQRIAAGQALVIMDTGRPPPPSVAGEAHAGCLAFEFSTGRNRIIINCGKPATTGRAWRQASRVTAAHSTATLDESSSSRFISTELLQRLIGAPLVGGPAHVTLQRHTDASGCRIRARHDGYRERLGITHERHLSLSGDGHQLSGEDIFDAGGGHADCAYAIRFHLHPDVRVSPVESGRGFLLTLMNRETWAFAVEGAPCAVEESVYLPDPDGPRRAEQIVIYGRAGHQPRVSWTLAQVRAAREPAPRQPQPAAETPELPL